MKSYRDRGLLGVCIELHNNNYGSMLQSYATQWMLNQYGFEYELIRYQKDITPLYVMRNAPRVLNCVVWQDKFAEKQKRDFMRRYPDAKRACEMRAEAFERFRTDYFTAPMPQYTGYNRLKAESRKYNGFLVGSDQLWSPSGLGTHFYDLMFTPDEAFRMSFASSFGVKEIPWYQRSRTKTYLDRIPFISCRENSGSRAIKELTGRDVPVVADPTMLFAKDEWDGMLQCRRVQDGEYIFSYQLGTSRGNREEVLRLKEKTGLPIVSIHQFVDADLHFGDVVIEDAGPAEFVDLIRNAAYVCTDSFHCSVFSILYHKRFIVFNRYAEANKASKNTRIESLCQNLGLEERRFVGDIYAEIIRPVDAALVDDCIRQLREQTRMYLESAFDAIPRK